MNNMPINVEENENLTLDFKGNALDKILGSESRKPNDYFGIYKISALVIGASGSGKTSFILNLLFSDKLDCDNLVLIIPEESCYSGLYASLINSLFRTTFPQKYCLISQFSFIK